MIRSSTFAILFLAGLASLAAAQEGRNYTLPANPAAGAMPDGPKIDETHAYTLAELIDLAESSNPETRIAWNEARNAVASADLARGTFLPRLRATAIGGYTTSDTRDRALGLSLDGGSHASGTISALTLQWLLFDFGERSALVQAADRRVQIGDIRFTAAHQRLIYNVSLAYYALQTARARALNTEASLADAIAVESAATDRYKQGIGTVIEVAQAKQATAQARLARVQAEGAAQNGLLTLLAAMGIPPLTRISIAPLTERRLSSKLVSPVEEVIKTALARRPDVQAAYSAQQASLADVRAAQAARMPKVFVTGSGSYTSGNLALNALPGVGGESPTVNLSGHRLGTTIMGGITIPLFDGGARRTALTKARNEADSASAALTRVKDDAAQQIALAQNLLVTSLSAHEAAAALLAAAQTTYDASLAAYRSGVGASTEVLVAERQLIEARNVSIESYYGALSAAATLALSTGELGTAP